MISKNRRAYVALGVVLAAVASVALAGTFNLFSPATGVLKGSSSTYVTTAAVSSDIRAMWTGTCNASSFLRGDGACATPGGTVSSVGLTMPSGFSVSGSPVTSSGTLGVTTSLNGVLHGNGSGFTAGNVSLTSEVSNTLPVANGGTNLTTATDDAAIVGNGTTWVATAVPNCGSSTQALAYSTSTNAFSCQTISAGTGTVTSIAAGTGLSASPGSPITSSGTLSVDQAFTPTWTGLHTHSPTAAGTALTVNNTSAGANTTLAVRSSFSSASTTPLLSLKSTASTPFATFSISANGTIGTDDFALFQNGTNTDATVLNRSSTGALFLGAGGSNRIEIFSTGGVTVGSPTGGDPGAGKINAQDVQVNGASVITPTSGTYTATLSTGCTTTPTATVKWAKTGNIVVLNFGNFGTCTSNTTIMSLDASVPAAERPATNQCANVISVEDNTVINHATARIQTSGVVDFGLDGASGGSCSGAGWTASGTKSLGSGFSLVYQTAN